MDRAHYQRFNDQLVQIAEADPQVLGVVALGSMADLDVPFDDWSDHDLFLIAENGRQEGYRQDLSWLPDAQEVVWSFRETAHGLKVVYGSGHLVELAVFSLDEIALARVNRYRVLLDRADVERRMAEIAEKTHREIEERSASLEWLLSQAIGEALVAGLRAGRGELISARHRLLAAIAHVCRSLAISTPEQERAVLDDLDPLRRVEGAAPALADQLHAVSTAPIPDAVGGFLDLLEESFLLEPSQSAAIAAIRSRLHITPR